MKTRLFLIVLGAILFLPCQASLYARDPAQERVLEFACNFQPWRFEEGAIVASTYYEEQPFIYLNGKLISESITLRPGDRVTTADEGPYTEYEIQSVGKNSARIILRTTSLLIEKETGWNEHIKRISSKAPQHVSPPKMPTAPAVTSEEIFTLPLFEKLEYVILTSPITKLEASDGQSWRTRK